MQDSKSDIHARLTAYLSGAYSSAELGEFKRWLAADPARSQELDALRRIWEASAGIPPVDRVDEMWRDVASRLREFESSESEVASSPRAVSPPVLTLAPARRSRRAVWRGWVAGIAAAAAAVL